jgi:pimeloyl-ACP methyl ester carboxylesterase
MDNFIRRVRLLIAPMLFLAAPLVAQAQETIGIVIMHGKGGSPSGLVAELARTLESRGYLVANLDMPWSGRRNYDVDVGRAEQEVAAALLGLRERGAKKAFIAGHSQGGLFALHLAAKLDIDGYVVIAPGGSVANRVYRDNVGEALARARQLVADGKGGEVASLSDFEGAKGAYEVRAVPAAYVTWFEPDGAMNMDRAVRAVNPRVPVLWVAPKRDYPALIKFALPLYRDLPANRLTRLYQPDADHRNAPTVAADEIARWTREVAGSAK